MTQITVRLALVITFAYPAKNNVILTPYLMAKWKTNRSLEEGYQQFKKDYNEVNRKHRKGVNEDMKGLHSQIHIDAVARVGKIQNSAAGLIVSLLFKDIWPECEPKPKQFND